MPQRSTTDTAMAAREYTEEGFGTGEIVALVSLGVAGAFNSAWWPSILKTLRESGCPRNLLNLTKSYFTNRLAILQTNNTIEAEITKGCPQGSYWGPGLWNIQYVYNTLLELNYSNSTKAIAFADDLILMKRSNTVTEAENIANVEMTKITTWAKTNKIQFNERKLKVLLLTRKKRKERRNWKYIFWLLTQVPNLKYLGIILDSKLSFRDHTNYTAEKCSKLIFALARSAKVNWGLGCATLKTIYTGAILPFYCTVRQFG
jgi:hypothetical protein